MAQTTPSKCSECRAKCFISEYCSPKWISTIDLKKNQVWYKKGQYIFYENTMVFGVHFVTHGKVKLVISSRKEQIVRLASDGHVLGLGHWGNEDQLYTASAVALDDSLICFVKNEDFYDACIANPKLTLHLLKYISNDLCETQNHIAIISQLRTRERVAETLNLDKLRRMEGFAVSKTGLEK